MSKSTLRRRRSRKSFIRETGASALLWGTLFLMTVVLPMTSLIVDVPRYMMLRTHLQNAADASTEAAARCIDVDYFQSTGQTRLDNGCVVNRANAYFTLTASGLQGHYYHLRLTSLSVDNAQQTVSATATGSLRVFFNMTPDIPIHVHSISAFRMNTKG